MVAELAGHFWAAGLCLPISASLMITGVSDENEPLKR
jgi:hypothetical protein